MKFFAKLRQVRRLGGNCAARNAIEALPGQLGCAVAAIGREFRQPSLKLCVIHNAVSSNLVVSA